MSNFFAAVDCGTSKVKAGIFSEKGFLKSIVESSYPCLHFKDGRIEQDPYLLLQIIFSSLKKAVAKAKIKPSSVCALSFSTQRATFLAAGKNQKPLTNFISWQDARAKDALQVLDRKISDRNYYKLTGLPKDPVFSLAKILWIKKQLPELYRNTDKFLLLHSYILKHLGCKDYLEDHSNASLTGFFDVKNFCWSSKILKDAKIAKNKLAGLVSSGEIIGFLSKNAAKKSGLRQGLPLVSGGGDQQCAGLGAGGINPEIAELALGTSAVPLVLALKPIFDPQMRVMCCAHVIKGVWELEGFQSCAGLALLWLDKVIAAKAARQSLPKNIGKNTRKGAGGVIFYPYLAGASSPTWNPQARGIFFGLNLGTTKFDLFRAVTEGVSFQTREILELFSFLGLKIREVRLTGGYSKVSFWRRMQADIFQKRVAILKNPQASLAGAAILAVSAVAKDRCLKDVASAFTQVDKCIFPDRGNKDFYDKVYLKYRNIYKILNKGRVF